MKHSLLRNSVYLFLLAFYNNKEMPSYVELSKKIGISRQTVSKKVRKLLDDNIIQTDEDNILFVSNEMELNEEYLKEILIETPNIPAVELEKRFFTQNKEDIILNLGISNAEFYVQQRNEVVIYGIVSEGIIKYVGSTKCYTDRINQHIRKRPFLTKDNFIILLNVSDTSKLTYEKQLIKILQPEWNIMSK